MWYALHMLKALRKLVGMPSRVERLAQTDDRESFIRGLVESDIFVIATIDGDGLDASTMTQEQLRAEIQRAAKAMSEREVFYPLVYERDGRWLLPFFTRYAYVETFIGLFSRARNRVYPFEVVGAKGAILVQIMSECDVLAMNDGSDRELVLPQSDMTILAAYKTMIPSPYPIWRQ